jgi:hypothetical protein
MRLVRSLVPSLALVAALSAADPAPSAAPLVVRVADGAKLVKDWDASIYAKVWSDPAAEALRAAWTEALTGIQAEVGFDPVAALSAMRGLHVAFLGMQGGEPKIHMRVDLGTFAAPVLAQLRKDADKGQPKQVAGADEAVGDEKATFARFGNVLVFALNCDPQPAAPAGESSAALALDLDAKRLVDLIAPAIPAEKKAEFDNFVKNAAAYLGQWKYRGDIVPEGIRERLEANVPTPGTQPVDRAVLARLPATTLMAVAYGFDGKAYWKLGGEALLTQIDGAMHPGAAVGPEQTAQEIQGLLNSMGVNASLQEVVEGLSGTSLLAITQSAPFPALTIALPRSAPLDQLLGLALSQIGGALPEEGQSAPIVIPGAPIPVPITLLRDAKHWVLSTDPMLAGTWSGGAPGGFADSPMAKTLYAKAPADAALLGASDTPAVLRTVQGLLGFVLASNDSLTPQQKQAINGALTKLAANASTGYVFTGNDAKGSRTEVRGLVGSGVVPVMVGAVVAGAVMSKRMNDQIFDGGQPAVEDAAVTPEAKAIDTLSGVLFQAQMQFKGANYVDQDGDSTGEYGTLAELTGLVALPGGNPADNLAAGLDLTAGYTYAVYLPDAAGAAFSMGSEARVADKAAADAQESKFVIYGWPSEGAGAGRMFAVDQGGIIFESPYTGAAPVWNALYNGQGWDGIPAWQPAQR